MKQENKSSSSPIVLAILIIILAIIAASTGWRLITARYPTHSDVFYMGVECGALAIILLISLFLISLLTYRLILLHQKT
jgi:hypothetical protein